MPASARVMTSTTNGLRGAMKPSTSVRGLSAICGAAASLLAFGDGAAMGEKWRGALTAGAALNPGLNAEAADSVAASTTNNMNLAARPLSLSRAIRLVVLSRPPFSPQEVDPGRRARVSGSEPASNGYWSSRLRLFRYLFCFD